MHVVCVGDLMVDILAQLPGPLAPGSDTPASVEFHGGGAAANVAAWVVEAGGSATFVGRAGDDVFGHRAVAELRAGGVESAVTLDPERATGTCIVLVTPDGERTMVPSSGANSAACDLATLPGSADWLYVSGYALLDAAARPFALAALEYAREGGWSIAVDAASAAPLGGAPAFLDWIGTEVLLFGNTAEAAVLTGEADDPAAAALALALRCGQAIVKCGASGAVWSDGRGVRAVPAQRVPVVDSTGAGDAFAAGFLTGFLAGGRDVEAGLSRAVALASRAVGRRGARPATCT